MAAAVSGLSPVIMMVLIALVKHAGMVITHRHLLEQAWGPGNSEQVQYLRVYMTQLRHKLQDDPAQPKHPLTELGVGYRLEPDVAAG